MRAVNLLPQDGRSASAGHKPVGAYVLIGALAAAVAMTGAWTVTDGKVSEREQQLAGVQREAQAAKARAAQLAPYTRFSSLSKARTDTVAQVVGERFDWAHALRELARVLPAETDLLTLKAAKSEAEAGPAGAGAGAPSDPAAGAPSLELSGCTASQIGVARLMARLRAVDGVTHVKLTSSEKTDNGTSTAGSSSSSSGSADGDCRTRAAKPQFQMTLTFRSPGGAPAPAPGAPVRPGGSS